MSDQVDVLVLREGVHGMGIESYVEALRERLPECTVELARTPREERALIERARVVTGTRVDDELLDWAGDIRLFACMYAGTDHLPLASLADRDVAVTGAAGVHGPNVAEHVLGAMLSFSRQFHVARRQQRHNEWRTYRAGELKGERVAVVGLGAIGTAVVERLSGFGVETVGVRYTPEKGGPTDEVLGFDRFHGALADTAYLALACPLTDTTRGLVDREAFRTLPDSAVVINVARGPVVDTGDLVHALQRHQIRGAALDVTDPEPLPDDHPLWSFGNVLITPHNAGQTPRYYERLVDIVAHNAERALAGEFDELENRVQ